MKGPYENALQKALEDFVAASNAIAAVARNHRISSTHRDYAKGAVADRVKQLKKEMEFEPTEFKVSLPPSGD